jgi:hypothetical protein
MKDSMEVSSLVTVAGLFEGSLFREHALKLLVGDSPNSYLVPLA